MLHAHAPSVSTAPSLPHICALHLASSVTGSYVGWANRPAGAELYGAANCPLAGRTRVRGAIGLASVRLYRPLLPVGAPQRLWQRHLTARLSGPSAGPAALKPRPALPAAGNG